MRFTCTIDLDNDAFEEAPDHLAHLIQYVGLRVEGLDKIEPDGSTILDFNGNTVGHWSIEDDAS